MTNLEVTDPQSKRHIFPSKFHLKISVNLLVHFKNQGERNEYYRLVSTKQRV